VRVVNRNQLRYYGPCCCLSGHRHLSADGCAATIFAELGQKSAALEVQVVTTKRIGKESQNR